MAHLSQIDFRLQWLIETISSSLGIFDASIAAQTLAEHGDLVDALFNDPIDEQCDSSKQILFVWRSFYDKLVEETITVFEEGKLERMFFSDGGNRGYRSNYHVLLLSYNNSLNCVVISFPLLIDRHTHR